MRENLQEIVPCEFQLMQAKEQGVIKQKKGCSLAVNGAENYFTKTFAGFLPA